VAWDKLLRSMDDRLRDAGIEELTEIAQKLYAQTGEQLERGLAQDIPGRTKKFMNSLSVALGPDTDIAKRALIRVCEECYLDSSSPLFGSRVLIFTHDELILEIPETQLHAASARQTSIMLEEGKKGCPDVKISAEPAAMRRWCKDAEPVYVDGKLVVWSPQ
jgi:hypothetical protein